MEIVAFLSRIRCVGEVIARRRDYANAELDQREDAQFLRHEIPGEAAGVLHDQRAQPIRRPGNTCNCEKSLKKTSGLVVGVEGR